MCVRRNNSQLWLCSVQKIMDVELPRRLPTANRYLFGPTAIRPGQQSIYNMQKSKRSSCKEATDHGSSYDGGPEQVGIYGCFSEILEFRPIGVHCEKDMW